MLQLSSSNPSRPSSRRTSFINDNKSNTIYKSLRNIVLRTFTICLGSLYVGFVLVYYYTMADWYCTQLHDINQCSETKYYLVGSIIPFAAILSSLFLCRVLQRFFSRRWILIIACMLGLIAGIFMIVECFISQNVLFEFYSVLAIIGRIFHGLSVGIFMTFCLVVINEFSPDELKMTMVNIYQISIELGILITHIVFLVLANLIFKKNDPSSWKQINSIMFSFPLMILIVQALLLIFVFKEQTPFYLLKKQKYAEAKSVISSIFREEYVDEKFLELKAELNMNYEFSQYEFNKKQIYFKGIFLGAYAIIAQQMSGINFLNNFGFSQGIQRLPFGLYLFLEVLPEFCQILGTLSLLIINKSTKLRKYFGQSKRRRLIQIGSIISCVLMLITLILQIAFNVSDIIWVIIQCTFMLSFGFTLGPVCWLYVSELLNCSQLQKVVAIHWFLAFINIEVLSLLLISHSTLRILIPSILFGCCFIISIFNKWYILQTKNQSTLQITRKINDFSFKFWKKQQ